MHALDSTFAFMLVSAAKRSSRARRGAAALATQGSEIQPLPRWTRSQSNDPGAAAFPTGAGLALFDAMLRSGPDGAGPVFAGCLRQRFALRAADSCAAPSILQAAARPARPGGCIVSFVSMRRRAGDSMRRSCARRGFLD
ncbi:DUF1403 family protein [Methylocystis sp. IM3]|uniref:DUF1403 family protein n=1 Tax=unclassified Methylocystis TaxID=2625913 RepID=UPI003119F4E8